MTKPSYYRDLQVPGQWTGEREFQRSSILAPKVIRQPGCDQDRMDELDALIEVIHGKATDWPAPLYGGVIRIEDEA